MGTPEDQKTAFPPHKVIGNIYYVGTKTLSSFLIVTPQGNILIDSTYERNVPVIKKSVEQLGFKFSDIKILLGNHAHGDHQEGDAMVKELTGAQVSRDGRGCARAQGDQTRRQGAPDRPDRARWRVGDAWRRDTRRASDGGPHARLHNLDHGRDRMAERHTTWSSAAVCARRLRLLAAVVDELNRSFKVVRSLPCDVPLGDHPAEYKLQEKYAKLQAGGPNPFIDKAGCLDEADIQEAMFERFRPSNKRPASSRAL